MRIKIIPIIIINFYSCGPKMIKKMFVLGLTIHFLLHLLSNTGCFYLKIKQKNKKLKHINHHSCVQRLRALKFGGFVKAAVNTHTKSRLLGPNLFCTKQKDKYHTLTIVS